MRQSSSEKHSRDSFFFRTQKPKGKVSLFFPSTRCVHCPVAREWSTSIIVLPAQAPDICVVTFLAYLLSLVCSSKRSQIDWARGTSSFCRRGRVGMTDIDSGSGEEGEREREGEKVAENGNFERWLFEWWLFEFRVTKDREESNEDTRIVEPSVRVRSFLIS